MQKNYSLELLTNNDFIFWREKILQDFFSFPLNKFENEFQTQIIMS